MPKMIENSINWHLYENILYLWHQCFVCMGIGSSAPAIFPYSYARKSYLVEFSIFFKISIHGDGLSAV